MTKPMLVLTTVATAASADELSRQLLERRLAACVSQLSLSSSYWWQGAICDDAEVLLLIKTTSGLWRALETAIKELHPYEVPELLALETDAAGEAYAAWLARAVAPSGPEA